MANPFDYRDVVPSHRRRPKHINQLIGRAYLVFGGFLVTAGISWGAYAWLRGIELGEFATSGQVTLASLPIIVGTQLLLAFLAYDMSSSPRVPLHGRL